MRFFGKKRSDVIDLTKYAKKGVAESSMPSNMNSGEVLDLGSSSSNTCYPSVSNNSSSDGSVNLGFLDNLASGSSNSGSGSVGSSYPANTWNNTNNNVSITDSLREARRQKLKSAFTEMKNKIDDSNFKIANLHRKINDMEERLRDLERRR